MLFEVPLEVPLEVPFDNFLAVLAGSADACGVRGEPDSWIEENGEAVAGPETIVAGNDKRGAAGPVDADKAAVESVEDVFVEVVEEVVAEVCERTGVATGW